MADRIALWGRDIDEPPADVDTGHVDLGHHEPVTEPIPVAEAHQPEPVFVRSPVSAGTTLTFKPAPAPWYRTRRGLIVPISVIALAVVSALLPMLLRSPAPVSEEPAPVTPTTAPVPSGVQPTSGSIAPTLSSRPLPPPALPPPPPPPPPQDAPAYTPQYQPPRYSEPAPAKPEIGVTRAPISVAPKPVTPPTSAKVGAHGDNPGRW